MFGAINALFSGLAFLGVIYAIILQRQELQLQRKELELTRAELEGQKKQLEAQNETFKKQNFENTFFQLVSLHHEIVNSMYSPLGDRQKLEGRECMQKIYNEFKNHFNYMKTKNPSINELDLINKIYLSYYKGHQSKLGHYFRNLYNIIKFVKNNAITEKRLYTNIIRAQLSSTELALLFYNCLSDMGKEKFKPLIEEFSLLKNMEKEGSVSLTVSNLLKKITGNVIKTSGGLAWKRRRKQHL